MQTLFETLRQNPHAAVQSKDDAKCKAFLSAVGLLDDLKRSSTPYLSAVSADCHETHWVVGALMSGYPTPEQNGYLVFCLPKSRTTRQQVREFLDSLCVRNQGEDTEYAEIQRPREWRGLN